MDSLSFVADKIVARFQDQLMEIYLRGGPAGQMMKRIKGEFASTPSGGELNDLYTRDVVYSDQKARDLIGYDPQFDIESGIRQSVQWLQHNELADGDASTPTASAVERKPTETEATSLQPSRIAEDLVQ